MQALQAGAGDHAKFVVAGTASAYLLLSAKPVKASKPAVGADWGSRNQT
jgi:hypothetical protein